MFHTRFLALTHLEIWIMTSEERQMVPRYRDAGIVLSRSGTCTPKVLNIRITAKTDVPQKPFQGMFSLVDMQVEMEEPLKAACVAEWTIRYLVGSTVAVAVSTGALRHFYVLHHLMPRCGG
jgi:hypothetical protein